jgi:hypothetical protein
VRVTDEVDITAKDLPKVDSPSDPGITARPGVAETKADLSPVDEHRPAATLTLDEEPARSLDEESSAVDGKALARDLPESDETKRRRAVPRALGGDGFEGPSLEPRQKLESPATPAPSRVERELVVVLVLFGLTAALIALGWFTLT